MRRKHRCAVVTGGAQGIGKAVLQRLRVDGFAVTALDADGEACEEARQGWGRGGDVRFLQTDVADEEQVRAAVAEVVAEFGRLDALVNNAAISQAHGPGLTLLEREAWDRVLAVNLTGPFLCAKHCAPHLRATRGAVVNIASTRALMSEPNTEAYAASKGGVVALSHALAMTLGPEIRVNCVSPGWIEVGQWQKRSALREERLSVMDHAQHPVGRVGKPEDVAALVSFLLSEEAGFVTGSNFVVDGGMTRKMIYV